VKHFHNIQRAFALEYGYVETLFGMKQVLNVSDNQHDEQTEVYEAEDGERSSYWGNQAINGPVQGTAHQLMICALVNLLRKREEYAVLGIPPLEVHDALYMVLRLFDLPEGAKKAKYLLEQESIRTSQKEFGIKWRIPIVTEAKAGLRLGCKVKIKEDIKIGEFLANWFYLCRKQETELETDFAKVVAEALVKG
jgi:DNA polymerase I-like protein with 3'-5' exonuclease and polymerase domains